MSQLNVNFHSVTRNIESLINEDYVNDYTEQLSKKQISRIVESIILKIPTPTIWIDHFKKEIFTNGYIIAALKEFRKDKTELLNVTGCLLTLKGDTYETLDFNIARQLYDTELSVKVLMEPVDETSELVKNLVWSFSEQKDFKVR